MKKFSYKRAFFNWLQVNGLYHAYFTNYIQVGRFMSKRNDFFANNSPFHYVNAAFAWTQTPEGGMYRSCRHDDWICYLKTINKRI